MWWVFLPVKDRRHFFSNDRPVICQLSYQDFSSRKKQRNKREKKQIHVQEQTIKNKNKKEKHNLSDPSSSVDKKRRRNMACSLYDHAPAQEQEFYNFGRLFLGYHCYTLRLSDLFLSEEKILKEIMHFYYMTYLATP